MDNEALKPGLPNCYLLSLLRRNSLAHCQCRRSWMVAVGAGVEEWGGAWFRLSFLCYLRVDWKTHIGMVYHLESTSHRHSIVIKVKLDHKKPEVETVSHIWKTAEFHEREAYMKCLVWIFSITLTCGCWYFRMAGKEDTSDAKRLWWSVNMIKL